MHQIDQQLALRPIYPTGGAAHSAHLDPLAGKGKGKGGEREGRKREERGRRGRKGKGGEIASS